MARRPRPRSGTAEDSATLLASLTALLTAEKTVAAPIAWVNDDGDLRFTATLDIDCVTEPRLTLFGRATAGLPDRKMTLGLRWQDETSRGGNFDRLEWRPVNTPDAKRMAFNRSKDGLIAKGRVAAQGDYVFRAEAR